LTPFKGMPCVPCTDPFHSAPEAQPQEDWAMGVAKAIRDRWAVNLPNNDPFITECAPLIRAHVEKETAKLREHAAMQDSYIFSLEGERDALRERARGLEEITTQFFKDKSDAESQVTALREALKQIEALYETPEKLSIAPAIAHQALNPKAQP
jgi:DNA repair exonuclease SbcCD ATPase subunit